MHMHVHTYKAPKVAIDLWMGRVPTEYAQMPPAL